MSNEIEASITKRQPHSKAVVEQIDVKQSGGGVMRNEHMKIMEFVFQYEREKWNNGTWSPKVSQIIQHMKNSFDWEGQYTQGVLTEMESNGWVQIK